MGLKRKSQPDDIQAGFSEAISTQPLLVPRIIATPREVRGLLRDFIRGETANRESLAMGLDSVGLCRRPNAVFRTTDHITPPA